MYPSVSECIREHMKGMAIDPASDSDPDIRTIELPPEHELRIEFDAPIPFTLQQFPSTLTAPSASSETIVAEVFGKECLPGRTYTLDAGLVASYATGTMHKIVQSAAIFSWSGAMVTLHNTAHIRSCYVSRETPMIQIANLNAALQTLRQQKQAGPNVLIVGNASSGRATVARTMLNYMVRGGFQPIYADLDIVSNSIALPGTIACMPIEHPMPENCLDNVEDKAAVLFFYGHTSLLSTEIYARQIEKLGNLINKRFEANDANRMGGLVVRSMPITAGAAEIINIAKLLFIDVLVVIEQEKLYHELKTYDITVVKLDKNQGVACLESAHLKSLRNQRIHQYFYGRKSDLQPHTKTLHFSDVDIFRIGGGPAAPASALPIGGQRRVDPNKLTKVLIGPELLHSILGVSYAADSSNIICTNIAGYVYISAVDISKKQLTILCPAQTSLPSRNLLLGTLKVDELGIL